MFVISSAIKKIAEEACVSTATVSRVFSGKDYVSPEKKEAVLAVAAAYDYFPKKYKKATAHSLYRSTIVVMLPEIDNSFYCDILTGIQNVFDQYDVDILICSSNNSIGRELHLLSLCEQLQISGLILVPVSGTAVENFELLKKMHQKIPVILLDRSIQGLDFDGVFMDNYNASCKATNKLINNGHEHIAFIAGAETSTALLRLKGYIDTMKGNGMKIPEDYILHGNFEADTAYRLTKEFLSEQLKHYKRPEVTAFFTASSKMMSGCLLAIAECGLSVPEDVAVITFGETFLVRHNISYVKYPSLSMGEECARIMIERLQTRKTRRPTPVKNIIFETELELSGSEVYPFSRGDKKENIK